MQAGAVAGPGVWRALWRVIRVFVLGTDIRSRQAWKMLLGNNFRGAGAGVFSGGAKSGIPRYCPQNWLRMRITHGGDRFTAVCTEKGSGRGQRAFTSWLAVAG
jgi:hypothetical protein